MKTVSSFEFRTRTPDRDQVRNWSEEECLEYLRQNYGLRGVDGKAITKEPKNRTIENLRKEVVFQINHNYIYG